MVAAVVVEYKLAVFRDHELASGLKLETQRSLVVCRIYGHLEIVDHSSPLDSEILLILFVTDTGPLEVSEDHHAALHVVEHNVLEDWRPQIFVFNPIELDIVVLNDLEHILIVIMRNKATALHRVAHLPLVIIQNLLFTPVK